MFNSVQEYTLSLLPARRRQSQGGWITFNAVCCHHNGEDQDKKLRGAVITSADGSITYKCFNCKFKSSYVPGRPLSFKYRKLLSWFGADPNEIQRLVFEALRVRELIQPEQIKPPEEEIKFDTCALPAEAQSFWALAEFYELAGTQTLPKSFNESVSYVYDRRLDMKRYDFYWTPEVENKLCHRIIVPFMYQGNVVGYTARANNDSIQPKYHSSHPAGVVFNLDRQEFKNKFVIVCEGPIDAMSIDGVSVQGNEISEQQAELIEALGKEVIVVPDFDKHVNKQGRTVWPGRGLVDHAIQYGWSVSFPVWRETCKDVNKSLVRYGKLFTLKAILDGKESNKLKIELMKKRV